MGNVNEASEVKTNAYMFSHSVEQSFVTCAMLNEMVQRWAEIGKPLFLIPKDFKERILTNSMD